MDEFGFYKPEATEEDRDLGILIMCDIDRKLLVQCNCEKGTEHIMTIYRNGAVLVSWYEAPVKLWFGMSSLSPFFKENKYKLDGQQSKSLAVMRRMKDPS